MHFERHEQPPPPSKGGLEYPKNAYFAFQAIYRWAIIWKIDENVSITNVKKQERAASRKFLAH